jgi:minor extracellular serine protease Vpr
MIKVIPSLALLSVLTSCGFNTSPAELKKLDLVNSNIISIRAINEDVGTFMVRLEAPGLIESADTTSGKITINKAQKSLVLTQQQEFVEAIKKIDPNIHVLYSTKLVMNTVTIVASPKLMKTINGLPMVKNVREATLYGAPKNVTLEMTQTALQKGIEDLTRKNSVSFIGGLEAREELNLTGKGLRIGIIDTGIDYTHTMFGGSGSVEEFKAINPDIEAPNFPNDKILGGIDLVGDKFSPGSPYKEHKIARPDKNPLDYNGHGTHVAGTVAGIGDGVNTYDGVAPDAKLYGIKVFGQNSTNDSVVIAALEYSIDPNGDLDPSDRLDIVNLSLGGPYGKPSINYAEAVKNTVRAGVSFVAAAGNSGNNPYIVGAPSTAAEAFSVAAGIDYMSHNIQVAGSEVQLDGESKVVSSPYATFSKEMAEGDVISAETAYVGLASEELNEEMRVQVNGKIAIIDRGGNPFFDKATYALNAGAVGVVIVNNVPDAPSAPGGGEGKMSIPVVMISKAEGQKIKDALKSGATTSFSFSKEHVFEMPEYIDTVTGFSSRGPRSEDGLIKPEIVAPGQQITSAATGTGNKGERLNGTSMASPHMAGVMALIKQRFPNLSVMDHKHILMSTAKIINDHTGVRYPVTAQGAGRVDVMKAAQAKLLPSRGGFSLGKVNLLEGKTKTEKVKLTNLTSEEISFSLKAELSEGMTLAEASQQYTVPANGSIEVSLTFGMGLASKDRSNYEGYVKLVNGSEEIAHFPVLAVIHQTSWIKTAGRSQDDKKLSLTLKNYSSVKGLALPFNLIATDERKPDAGSLAHIRSRACDLKSAGYRLVSREVEVEKGEGEEKVKVKENQTFLQLGAKLYESVSDWEACELTVLIDSNNDGVADQEWVGTKGGNLPGVTKSLPDAFYSMLLDASKAKEIRSQYEVVQNESRGEDKKEQDYRPALQWIGTYSPFQMSSVTMMEVELGKLQVNKEGTLKVKIAALNEGGDSIMADDYLMNDDMWHEISLQNTTAMPEVVELKSFETTTVMIPKQKSGGKIVLYSPTNSDGGNGDNDVQEIIVR